MRTLLTCLLLALSLPATAQIYSYTDANGNTVYTNQPPEGIDAKTIDLPPTNSVAAQPVSAPSTTPDNPVAGNAYRVLQLTDIPDDEAMRANNGTFSVGVILQPALAGQPLDRGDAGALERDGEQTLLAPALALHLVRIPTMAAVALGMPPHATPPFVSIAQCRMAIASASLSSAGL